MTDNLILSIGLIIISGYFAGLIARRFKLPRVTGYIVIGIIFSPSMSGAISESSVDSLEIVTSIALGIIAYSIGGSLHWDMVKKLERSIAWITPLQAIATWVLTAVAVALAASFALNLSDSSWVHSDLPVAIIIGAIAVATAPAAIMEIIHEYRAEGPLTTTLLSVVAIDDALGIIIFSFSIGASGALAGMTEGFSLYEVLGEPLLDIIVSIAIGAALALFLIYISRILKERSLMLVVVLGTVILCVGITEHLEVSLILSNMMLGVLVSNLANKEGLFSVIDDIEDAVFTLFFVVAGLHFDLESMEEAWLIAITIVGARFIAKYYGTMAGAQIAGSPQEVKKYLGLALIPTAGVSIGLALLAKREFPEFGDLIYNSILATVIINETIGPLLTRLAIYKAGEQHTE